MRHKGTYLLLALASLPVGAFMAIEVADRDPEPPPALAPLAPDLVSRDVALLVGAVREGHAALYRYRTPAEVEEILGGLDASVAGPMSPVALWRTLVPAIGAIRDAHLSLMPSGSMYAAFFRSPGLRLPFTVDELGGRFRILERLSPAAPESGSEIVSIEGVPMSRLEAILRSYVPTDGGVVSRRRALVERDFDLLCALHFGLQTSLRMEVRTPEGDRRSLAVPTVSHQTLEEARARRRPAPGGAGEWNELVELPDGQGAILRIVTFDKDAKPDVEKFLAHSFRRLRDLGVEHLLIDLRNNRGGRDLLGARLYSYVAAKRFRWVEQRRLNERRFDFVRGTGARWLNLRLAILTVRPAEGGGYVLDEEIDGWLQPREPRFAGRVTLLVDGTTFSTASELASVFKSNRRGRIVGEESGSAYQGDSGGPVGVFLPGSGLILNLPVVEYDLAVAPIQPLDRGVLPDLVVEPTFEDRFAGRDPVLEGALRLAGGAE